MVKSEYIQRSKDIFNKIETYLQNTNAKFNNIMDIQVVVLFDTSAFSKQIWFKIIFVRRFIHRQK